MATILITGFGPFIGAPDNPSAALAIRLTRVRRPALAAHTRVVHVFATSYAAVDRELPALIKKHRPRALIMFGLAGLTKFVRIERQARNRASVLLPDVQGVTPRASTIRRHAPPALRARAPLARLVTAASAAGLPCRLSSNAGRYLCNYVYWRALEAADKSGGPEVVVFVHVPKLHDQSRPCSRQKRPSLAQLARAGQAIVISAAAAASAKHRR